eukprot:Skav205512  [mRNA]  locus=scaffold231:228539:236956:- [translate_table: standard]
MQTFTTSWGPKTGMTCEEISKSGLDPIAVAAEVSHAPPVFGTWRVGTLLGLQMLAGRTVAVFLEVVRKKKRLSASAGSCPGKSADGDVARQRSPSMRLAMVSDDKVGALRKVVVFRTLAQEQLENLANALEVESRRPGEIIFNQGEPGKVFYIIHTGLLEVSINGRKVRTLGMGDYVGERALLLDENRSATVKVVEDCELWKMGADDFNEAGCSLQCMRVIGRGGFGVVKMAWSPKATVIGPKSAAEGKSQVSSDLKHHKHRLICPLPRPFEVALPRLLVVVGWAERRSVQVEQKQQKALAHERNILAELDRPGGASGGSAGVATKRDDHTESDRR